MVSRGCYFVWSRRLVLSISSRLDFTQDLEGTVACCLLSTQRGSARIIHQGCGRPVNNYQHCSRRPQLLRSVSQACAACSQAVGKQDPQGTLELSCFRCPCLHSSTLSEAVYSQAQEVASWLSAAAGGTHGSRNPALTRCCWVLCCPANWVGVRVLVSVLHPRVPGHASDGRSFCTASGEQAGVPVPALTGEN